MALYQNIRPTEWEDVLGNAAAVEVLTTSVAKPLHDTANPSNDRPHVFGLVGPSGCGKTTLARIAATKLGAGIGIHELNGSDTRGIDTARSIVEQMKFSSFDGSPQVWIIDECHKLTSDFWNCLLKPLEDTPDHVYFFLCTTEGNKIPSAARTRTKIVTVESQKQEELTKWLRIQAHKHGWTVSRPILELIGECSDGSPRQALQFVESVLGVPDEARAKAIIKAGIVDDADVKNLAALLIKPGTPWKTIADQLRNMKDKDAESTRRGVMGYCQAILLNGRDDIAIARVLEIFALTNCYDGMPVLTTLAYQANKSHGG